jgi:multidrug efflux pump subunit AcrB
MNWLGLLGRKKGSLCIWIGLCIVSLCVIYVSDKGSGANSSESYAVSIRHYGVDARGMERTAAIPLEDALFSINGVKSVQSSSENGLARVFVRFKSRRRGQYESVREAAQRVYEGLPPSVQRPEIQSSNNSRIPVWSAAVYSDEGKGGADTAMLLERALKPRLEGLEGAGEVIVSGIGMKEIIIAIDQEIAASLALNPGMVAWELASSDALFPGGTMLHERKEIIVSIDGRYSLRGSNGVPALGDALISLGNGRAIRLAEIAAISERERMPDTLSRLNGKKTAMVSVMGNSGADLRKLSRDIARELDSRPLPLVFTVLSDWGAEEAAAFRSVFFAALQGACMVAVLSFLLSRRKNSSLRMDSSGLFCALSVPAVCLISAAILALCGFPPERFALAGIAAGAGAAVDPVILLTEKLRPCRDYPEAGAALREIRGPLVAGSTTTLAALLPLSGMEGGSGPIVWAIGAVTIIALLLGLSFLPPLLLWDLGKVEKPPVKARNSKHDNFFSFALRRLVRWASRLLAINARTCTRSPALTCFAALVLSSLGFLALFIKGTDPGAYSSEDSVYGHIEFEGGLLSEETDRILAAYGEALAGEKGITDVQTGAKTGSGLALVSFDPKQVNADQVRNMVRSIPIPGGFLFFPETSSKERHWEIKIAGDDDVRLRELAKELALSCAGLPFIKERVLNFKDGSKKLKLLPLRDNFAEAGLLFYRAADNVRRGVHGPVAYKRTDSSGEIDVRIRTGSEGGSVPQRADVLGLLVSSAKEGAKPVRLDSLMEIREGQEPSSIKREDRRRTASITVSTPVMDPRRVKAQLEGTINKLELPSGYSIEFDPEAIRKARSLSGTLFTFLLALAFCYMVIASVNESFTVPLAVLAAVPPSLAVPAVFLSITGQPFNPQAACAFVVVSGMAVNSAVLCAGALGQFLQARSKDKSLCLYRALRQRGLALFATTATTVSGALPFLLLREGSNALVRTLSLVTALGVGASCLCAISVVPALSLILKKNKISVERISACAEGDVRFG